MKEPAALTPEVLLFPSLIIFQSFSPIAETGSVIEFFYTYSVELECFALLYPSWAMDSVPGPQIDTQETY